MGRYSTRYSQPGAAGAAAATYAPIDSPLAFGFATTMDPLLTITSRAIGAANRAVFARLIEGGTVSKVRLSITVQAGNISVAAYRNSGTGVDSVPGTRLATSGAVACPATGIADVALGASVDLLPGDWLGVSSDDTTTAFHSLSTLAAAAPRAAGRMGFQETAHPLPATPSITAGFVGPILLMAVP